MYIDESFVPSEETKPRNYPTEEDHKFTPDEQELIERKKEELLERINSNKKFAKGVEIIGSNITSFAVCRLLALTMGASAWPLVLTISGSFNMINNRDCLDFKIDRSNGEWEMSGLSKLIRFGLGGVFVLLNLYGTMGDLLQIKWISESVYEKLEEQALVYSRLIEEKDTEGAGKFLLGTLAVGALGGALFMSGGSKQ